jgi:hypothetical protein
MDDLGRIMSTQQLSYALRQLHVTIGHAHFRNNCTTSTPPPLIPMVNLHTFTLLQSFVSEGKFGWTCIEILTSSKVMPALRRANVSAFVNDNDLNRIGSLSLFSDHRHVDVHFAFSLINCPQYIEMTQYIPRGHHFHPREIVGATFLVNHWSDTSEWIIDGDPFVSHCPVISFRIFLHFISI